MFIGAIPGFENDQRQPSAWPSQREQFKQMTPNEAKRYAAQKNAEARSRANAMNAGWTPRPAATRSRASAAGAASSTSPAIAASWDRAFNRVRPRA